MYLKLSISVVFFGVVFASCSKMEKPNFMFILVDDLGWTDLGYSGSDFHESPNIDSLSRKSILFSNAYASGSVCSPSRASIMSGKHPARVNITDWIPGLNPENRKLLGAKDLNELPLEEITLAEVLEENEYITFFAGKWHLGSQGFLPENQGFQTNIGGYEKGHPPNGYYSPYKNPKLPDGPHGEYLTDRLTNEVIEFLHTHNNAEPFFIYLNYYSVHTPIQPCKRHLNRFNKKLESINDRKVKFTDEDGARTTINQRKTPPMPL